MKQLLSFTIAIALVGLCIQCGSNSGKILCTINLHNPSEFPVDKQVIAIPDSIIPKSVSDLNQVVVFCNETEIPSQIISHPDSSKSLLVFTSINAGSDIILQLKERSKNSVAPEFKKMTQAELSIREGGSWKWITKPDGKQQFEYEGGQFKNVDYLKVPKEHTDHSFFIRYEGPGWESDKVAYRFYLDWRNAIDIFGKLTPEMVLQRVGLDNYESYHDKCEWGMDIFKVAESLGIGSIAYWDGKVAKRVEKTDSIDCRISINGNLMSEVETNYYGWQTSENKVNLNSKISINAGSRLSKVELTCDQPLSLMCTGIIKHEGINAESNIQDSTTNWTYVSTYGVQSLANDQLGLAVIAERKFVEQITSDPLNQIVVLKPVDGKLTYYFLAAWEQEYQGIRNKKDFGEYLNQQINLMNHPVLIKTE